MKNLKNFFFSLLIISVFISSFFINITFAFDSYITTDFDKSSFPDIYTHNPYFKSVEVLYKNGVIEGYSDGKYKPGKKINRAEFIKIVLGANDIKSEGKNCFTDVKNEWFAKYVCSAKKKGIIKGYPDGKFRPERNISFVEAAKIIAEASNRFIDKKYNKNWYHSYVKEFEENVSIPLSITGFSHEITRGEMADMIVDMSMSRMGYDSLTYEDLEKFNGFSVFNKKKKIFSYVFEKYYKNKLPINGIPAKIDLYTFAGVEYQGSGVKLYRDNSNAYCYIKDSALMQIVGADPNTFKAFIDSVFDDEYEYDYAADKNSVYGPNKDGNCFVKIDTVTGGKKHFQKNIFTDLSDIYYYDLSGEKNGFIKINGVDPKTLKKNEELSSFDVNFYQDKTSFYILDKYFVLNKMPKIDADTLEEITDDIYKDKNNIYVSSKKSFSKQGSIDVKTFEQVDGSMYFFKDKNGLYTLKEGSLNKQGSLDGATFESVGSFYKDKNGVYVWDNKQFKKQIGYDGLTFKKIDTDIYADKNGVYIYEQIDFEVYSLQKKSGLDGSTFKKIDIDTYSNKDGVYTLEYKTIKKDFPSGLASLEVSYLKKHDVSDIATFKAVDKGEGIFFKDKENVYYYNYNTGTISKQKGADPASFMVVVSEDGNSAIVKDKNFVWFPDGKSEKFVKEVGADPNAIKIKKYKKEDYIYDKSSVWKIDDIEQVIKKVKGADPTTFFAK